MRSRPIDQPSTLEAGGGLACLFGCRRVEGVSRPSFERPTNVVTLAPLPSVKTLRRACLESRHAAPILGRLSVRRTRLLSIPFALAQHLCFSCSPLCFSVNVSCQSLRRRRNDLQPRLSTNQAHPRPSALTHSMDTSHPVPPLLRFALSPSPCTQPLTPCHPSVPQAPAALSILS